MKIFFFAIISLGFSTGLHAQDVEVINVIELERLINEKSDSPRIINFWATWCKPCVEEMPYFVEISQNKQFSDFEIILISVDFVELLDSKVKKFVKKMNISSTVKLIDNVDYNSWISKVDPSWSGAIPATLIIDGKSGHRIFYEKAFKEGDLQNALLEFRSQN